VLLALRRGCRGSPPLASPARRPPGRIEWRPIIFEGRRQLIVYRALYGPEVTTYAEGGAYPDRIDHSTTN
jgi:hypothetical protein